MSPSIQELAPNLRTKIEYLLKRATAERLGLEIFRTLTPPEEQARLWYQSRSEGEKHHAVNKLKEAGALWLAGVLEDAPPTYGRWETNQLPGESWHQWGEAVAVRVLSETGRTVWNPNHPGYEHLAKLAKTVNLYAGFFWKNREATHIQLRADTVRAYYDWPTIDHLMKERYRELPDHAVCKRSG